MHSRRPWLAGPGVLVVLALLSLGSAQGAVRPRPKEVEDRMSAMGRLAVRAAEPAEAQAQRAGDSAAVSAAASDDACVNLPRCPGGFTEGPAGGQAETSIAVDATGLHVVIGFNDTRGFSLDPVSVSGFLYSDDGGQTFVDGGRLPSPGGDVVGGRRYPQVFGDPEVKYLGGCTFLYSSILVKALSPTATAQTLGVHRSTDCGHTWAGPYEIPTATNPHGAFDALGRPADAADKEFMDVDPETGRVIVSWSNFTPFAAGGVEISTSFSNNALGGIPPTWSPRVVVAATAVDGQASVPRFASGSSAAYLAWRRFPSATTNSVGFARSLDNGATWSAPTNLTDPFLTMDQVLGNDRVNTSPSLAVDNSNGPSRGTVYLAYSRNDSGDGADVVVQRSTNGGLTFSAPVQVGSRPGADRAQWFPWVTVDRTSGAVWVFYYDQAIAGTGDLTEVSFLGSLDGGTTWSSPRVLTERPFHAGWGNDTGQPNLGDYNQAVGLNGEFFAAFSQASRPPGGFADGEPDSTSFTVPDVAFKRVGSTASALERINTTTLQLIGVTFTESGGNGFIDPGDELRFRMTLRNGVTNPLSAATAGRVRGTLTSTTPGVTVTRGFSYYPTINPGATGTNQTEFLVQVDPAFMPGTPIEFGLRMSTVQQGGLRAGTLLHTQFTGSPSTAVLLSENFEGVAPGSLPTGWSTAHGGGATEVPWTTRTGFCGGSNGAFHANANDGGPGSPTRFERLFSPPVDVPVVSDHVTLDFDVCYNTEDDPGFRVLAYDGFFLRVTDLTPERILRSVLVEAFADEFTTGEAQHYPKHFPRSSDPAYFQDMSAWAGDSRGLRHVRMRLPGMAGSTVQLRFEYTQDGSATCADVRPGASCGVFMDNLVVRNVVPTVPR